MLRRQFIAPIDFLKNVDILLQKEFFRNLIDIPSQKNRENFKENVNRCSITEKSLVCTLFQEKFKIGIKGQELTLILLKFSEQYPYSYCKYEKLR